MSFRRFVAASLPGWLAVALTTSVVGSGCAASDGMIDKLRDSARVYNRSLRWSDWDRAAEYLPPASADAFIEHHQDFEDRLVVLDYQLTRLEIDRQNGVAASQVEIQWHTDNQLVVRSTVVDHVWQWYEGRWFLVDERRSDGRPLAIFAERRDDGDHPYLPGLAAFRDEHAIGLDAQSKREREKQQRQTVRAERRAARKHGATYSLDRLDNLPNQGGPVGFN